MAEKLPEVGTSKPSRLGADLRVRVYSGLAMAAGALALTVAGGWAFGLLVAAAALIMAWEWGRLVRGESLDRLALVHAASCAAAVVLATAGLWGWALAALLAGVLGAVALDRLRLLSPAGVFYVGVPCLVLIWLRAADDLGLRAVLFVFLAVWATDIAAYVSGRLIGGAKLAPRISPGKTWSGLIGGVGASAILGAAFALAVPGASAARLGLIALVLAVVAQVGDLAESALKRRGGHKDASHLIPGHGGLLDRVDGLVAATVVSGALAALADASTPARGLLLGS